MPTGPAKICYWKAELRLALRGVPCRRQEAGIGVEEVLVLVRFVVFVVARSGFARPGVCVLEVLFRAVDDEPTRGELRVQVSYITCYIDALLERLPNTPLMVAGCAL